MKSSPEFIQTEVNKHYFPDFYRQSTPETKKKLIYPPLTCDVLTINCELCPFLFVSLHERSKLIKPRNMHTIYAQVNKKCCTLNCLSIGFKSISASKLRPAVKVTL